MPTGPSREIFAYAVSGAVVGAILRYLLSQLWPTPSAFPAPPTFPISGVVYQSVTVGLALFVAAFVFTAFRRSHLQAFVIGVCAGAASLSQYAAIGVSTVVGAGVLLLVLAPVCGLVGMTAGTFLALAFRRRTSTADDTVAQ